ncbi:MAG: crosslink repair DNA glycosylase YcaQ family protein [Methanomassiliicoccales archaeon]
MYDELVKLIESHTTTLVFTNTRSATETVAYKLKERGLTGVEAHHGSLSKSTRIDVEDQLKRGELRCVISSTSLELGIDIGSIDLVCQIGSPKSVAKGLQRIGRSGHSVDRLSKGRLLVFDRDDLVECAVLTRSALLGKIDRVDIPKNSLDVLAQSIVGMSIEKRWRLDEALQVIRRSYCYHDLTEEDYLSVLRYLGSKGEFENVYSKIWYDEAQGIFGKKRSARMIYFLNIGTIAEESTYTVITEKGTHVGQLSDKFVERLSTGDVFVLGGRTYEFVRTKSLAIIVKDAKGRRPTVPSWTGEMLPRSFDLSEEVGRFREEMGRLIEGDEPKLIRKLSADFNIDTAAARSIVNYFREQKQLTGLVPGGTTLLVEGIYQQDRDRRYIVFHFPFGRRTNDALSRAYAQAITEKYSCNVSISISDDCFLIAVPREIRLNSLHTLVSKRNLKELIVRGIRNSELFKQRFRHVAARSFMILRNYRGKELSVSRQQLRSSSIMDQLGNIQDFPVVKETFNEILHEVMDTEHALEILSDIESGKRKITYFGYTDTPSSFSHSILLSGVEDIILMEDRSSMLRELHRKVLSRVMGGEIRGFEFDAEKVNAYFASRRQYISEEEEVPLLLSTVGPLIMLKERGNSIYHFTRRKYEEVRGWAASLLEKGKVSTVWLDDLYFISADEMPLFKAIAQEGKLNDHERALLGLFSRSPLGVKDISAATGLSTEEVSELLHRLESMCLITRNSLDAEGKWTWLLCDAEAYPKDRALEKLITRQLEFFGPQTAEELSYRFRTDEAVRIADLLVNEGVVSRGYFVAEEVEQYMLTRDYLKLKNENAKVFDYSTVRSYKFSKSFAPLDSIEAYFTKFGSAGTMMDVFNRVSSFSRDEWEEKRKAGEILLGRFVRGRVRYIQAKDAPLFVSAYRERNIDEEAKELLELLKREGSLTISQIASKLKMDRERAREAVDRLDRALYIHRLFQENEEWGTRNLYAELQVSPDIEQPHREIIRRIVSAMGPMTVQELRSETGFWHLDLEHEAEMSGAVSIRVGETGETMFIMKEELQSLENHLKPEVEVKLISLLDPYASSLWGELTSKFGEGWYYPLVSRDRVVGMAEMWVMANCVEVRQLNVEQEYLSEVFAALKRTASFHSQFGLDILRIRELSGKAVGEIDSKTLETALSYGFRRLNGMLVLGNIIDAVVDEKRINAEAIVLQHIEEKFENFSDALEHLMSLRSDQEAILRVRHFVSLSHSQRMGSLVKMYVLPDHLAYTDTRWAPIFRAARQGNLSPQESELLELVTTMQPVSKKRILSASPLSRLQTLKCLRSLMRKSVIGNDAFGDYVVIPSYQGGKREALITVVRAFLEQFGAMTAEQLAAFIRPAAGIVQIRGLLKELEERRIVGRGYLCRGSDTLYYIPLSKVSKLKRSSCKEAFVVFAEDRLLLYFQERARQLFGFRPNGLVFNGPEIDGAFRGSLRRGELHLERFEGSERARRVLERQSEEAGILLRREREEEQDWDVIGFYEKSRLGR